MRRLAGPFAFPLPSWLDRLVLRIAPAWRDDLATAAPGRGSPLMQRVVPLLLLAVLVQSVAHVVDVFAFNQSIERLDADRDGSLVGWLGTVSTATAAFAALFYALLRPPLRLPMLSLGTLLAFLSLDDALALHELVARLAVRLRLYEHAGYDLWPLVYLPLMGVTGWLLARTARSLDTTASRALLSGLVCLVIAVGLESLAPVLFALGSGHGQPLYEAEVLVEEALETFGWGSIALGLWAGVVDLLCSGAPGTAPNRAASQGHTHAPTSTRRPQTAVDARRLTDDPPA